MIVADKEASIARANEISSQLMKVIANAVIEFHGEDDPAEQIYLAVHIVGNLTSRICVSLEQYGITHGIPNMTTDSIIEWSNLITKENVRLNKEITNEKVSMR